MMMSKLKLTAIVVSYSGSDTRQVVTDKITDLFDMGQLSRLPS